MNGRNFALLVGAFIAAGAIAGCGFGGDVGVPLKRSVAVAITPSGTVRVAAGGQLTFTANVTGTTTRTVTWSRDMTGPNHTLDGKIDSVTGVYTAPLDISGGNSDTIIATSTQDPSAKDQVNVDVNSGLNLNAVKTTLSIGETVAITAVSPGLATQTITFDLPSAGTLSATSVQSGKSVTYTAPLTITTNPQTVTLTARDKSGHATLTLTLQKASTTNIGIQ